jgi:hypothetical protein
MENSLEVKLPDYEEAKAKLESAVYQAAMYLERLENVGLINGSGHHAAQKIAAFAVRELASRWRGDKAHSDIPRADKPFPMQPYGTGSSHDEFWPGQRFGVPDTREEENKDGE